MVSDGRPLEAMSFFNKIEKHITSKIPNHLKKILIASGYDNDFAFINLKKENITEIEEFVNSNKEILKNTKYQNCETLGETFHFNIADTNSILSLPKLWIEVNTETNSKKEEDSSNIISEFDTTIAKISIRCHNIFCYYFIFGATKLHM